MPEKITITDEEIDSLTEETQSSSDEKIIICGLSDDRPEPEILPDMPKSWYWLLLVPFLNLFAVGWACRQKKYSFRHAPQSLTAGGLLSLLALFFMLHLIFSGADYTEWRHILAKKARKGVVIINVQEKHFLSTDRYFGTGVIIARKGNLLLVLTNRHVISRKDGGLVDEIDIVTSENADIKGRLAALPAHRSIDMALLVIPAVRGLEVLGDLGDYDKLKVGDEVVAIGHPQELDFTMTEGIVSALRDDLLIQTSADLNPGNSGGPLLNNQRQIIGINTFSLKNTSGLNFAYRADFVTRKSQWTYYENIDDLLSEISVR